MEIREERLIYPQFQLHRSSNRYSIFKRVFQITLLTRVAELFSQGSDRFIPAPDNERPKPSELRRAGECAQTYWGFIDGMLAPKPAPAAPVEPMPAETAPKLTEIARAMSWLDQVLNAGPVAQKEVERLAVDAGISARTLKRAKQRLKVKSVRKGRKHWSWQLLKMLPGAAKEA